MPVIQDKATPIVDQFPFVNEDKLRLRLVAMADKLDDKVRSIVYLTYNDPKLLSLYYRMRESGIYEKGGVSKVHRKVLEFPNFEVYDFCKAVFEPQYGINWYKEKKVWRHELVKPWLLVKTF